MAISGDREVSPPSDWLVFVHFAGRWVCIASYEIPQGVLTRTPAPTDPESAKSPVPTGLQIAGSTQC
jgi:hypothetical protein